MHLAHGYHGSLTTIIILLLLSKYGAGWQTSLISMQMDMALVSHIVFAIYVLDKHALG